MFSGCIIFRHNTGGNHQAVRWATFGPLLDHRETSAIAESWSSWLFGPERIYIYNNNNSNNNNNDNSNIIYTSWNWSCVFISAERPTHQVVPSVMHTLVDSITAIQQSQFEKVSLIGSLPILQCPSTLAGFTGKPMVSGGAFPARSSSAAVEEGFAPEISSRWAWQGSSGTCFAVPARK